MSDTYKTKCPNCDTVYKINVEQLNTPNRKARCSKCNSQFNIKDNLIADSVDEKSRLNSSNTADKTTTSTTNTPIDNKKTISSYQNPSKSKPLPQKDDIISESFDDGLIHDDMFSDEDFDDSQADSDVSRLEQEWTEESVLKAARNIELQPTSGFFKDASEDESEDESWLEALLEEENNSNQSSGSNQPLHRSDNSVPTIDQVNGDSRYSKFQDATPNSAGATNSLDSLLDDLGVSTVDTSRVDPKVSTKRMYERLESTEKPATNINSKKVITTLLWVLTCIVLLSLLFAQYVFFNVDKLVKDPYYAVKLQQICETLPCHMPSADLSTLNISNQTITTNKEDTHKSNIIATLSNTSSEAQLYPALKVQLFGDTDKTQVIGEFIATPDDYLVVPQRFIGAQKNTLFMLTIPIELQRIDSVEITPIY